ncbi:hypothetical protein COY95_02050, partial [Candidatus Woesearchaeota archaeon CG_4_10_14_0_8_um_filter_47_5]
AITIPENSSYFLNLSYYFSDPDNDTLTFSSTHPEHILVVILPNSLTVLSPQPGFVGAEEIVFYANDSLHTTPSNVVAINVTRLISNLTTPEETRLLYQGPVEIGRPVTWVRRITSRTTLPSTNALPATTLPSTKSLPVNPLSTSSPSHTSFSQKTVQESLPPDTIIVQVNRLVDKGNKFVPEAIDEKQIVVASKGMIQSAQAFNAEKKIQLLYQALQETVNTTQQETLQRDIASLLLIQQNARKKSQSQALLATLSTQLSGQEGVRALQEESWAAPQLVIITNTTTEEPETSLEIIYQTPAPELIEHSEYDEHVFSPTLSGSAGSAPNRFVKSLKVVSNASMHYYNVTAFTQIPEAPLQTIALFWIVNNTRIDVTNDPRFDVRPVDTDNNGVPDRLYWTVPQLSEQNFEVLLDLVNLKITASATYQNWTIFFETANIYSILSIKNLNPSQISYNSLWYYKSGTWYQKDQITNPTPANNYTLQTPWNGSSYTKGKIIYTITELDQHSLNVSFGSTSRLVENHFLYEPLVEPVEGMYLLNINNLFFYFHLCSFNDSYWKCNPSQGDFGFSGMNLTLNAYQTQTKYLEIPNNSTVLGFNFSVYSRSGEPLASYAFSGSYTSTNIDAGNLYRYGASDAFVIASSTLLQTHNATHNIWNYSSDFTINDVAVGSIDMSQGDEVLLTTDVNLIALRANGSKLREVDNGIDYHMVQLDKVIGSEVRYQKDANKPVNFTTVGLSKYQRFTNPYNVSYLNDSVCYVDTYFQYHQSK